MYDGLRGDPVRNEWGRWFEAFNGTSLDGARFRSFCSIFAAGGSAPQCYDRGCTFYPVLKYLSTYNPISFPFHPHSLMFALGSLGSVVVEDNQLIFGAVGTGVILAVTVVYYRLGSKDNERGFPKLPGFQLYHAWNFFRRRNNFLRSNFEQNLGKSFSFNVLNHTVIALNGDDARQIFYSNPHLQLGRGYGILKGAVGVSLFSVTVFQ